MSQRDRAEIEALLTKAAEQRRKLKVIQNDLEQLDVRIGRARSHADSKSSDHRSGGRKTSRKK